MNMKGRRRWVDAKKYMTYTSLVDVTQGICYSSLFFTIYYVLLLVI